LHGIFAFRLVVYYSQMISEEQEEPSSRRARQWAWAIPLSILLHAILVPLALVIFEAKLVFAPQARQEPERVVATTSIRMDRRAVPRRESPPVQTSGQVAPQPQSRPRKAQPQSLPEETPTPQPTPTPAPTPSSKPSPTVKPSIAPKKQQSTPLQMQIATQEQAFQKTVDRLRQSNNPLSIATLPPRPPTSYHRSAFDTPGDPKTVRQQMVLIPIQHWMTNSASCYYTTYTEQSSAGTSEDGMVPWPVCYPKGSDILARCPLGCRAPIPYPQPGYVLPPNTYLSPFLLAIYRHQV
jgi:outer membrane biosynthesis protein TonB